MGMALSGDVRRLPDGPNFAHLATLLPDGSPQVAAVWVAREGDRVPLGTGEGSLEAQRRGRIVERRPDGGFAGMDAIARKHTGAPFPWRTPAGRVVLVVEVERARVVSLPSRHAPPEV